MLTLTVITDSFVLVVLKSSELKVIQWMAVNQHYIYVNKRIFGFDFFFPDNSTDFWATDVKWFSLLESTNWLEIIRFATSLTFWISNYC